MSAVEIRLSPTQKQIVEFGDGPLLVRAGPGAGKTRVLTQRIQHLLRSGGRFHVLALTFTNKAANEMRDRLAASPEVGARAFIGTVHSFCMDVLSQRGQHLGFSSMPHIFESYQDKIDVLRDAAARSEILRDALRGAGDEKARGTLLKSWIDEISKLKCRFTIFEQVDDSVVRCAYEVYNEQLKASNSIDFDDLLFYTYRLFSEKPAVAGFYRKLYNYVCIDEAQDLNAAQYRLLTALCGSEVRNVMLVGDPNQAIYEWSGASPAYLEQFRKEFASTVIDLADNFRSSAAVVKCAQALVPSYNVSGRLAVNGSSEVIVARDAEDEAERVFRRLESLMKSGHPDIEGPVTRSRIAVLARNRYVLDPLFKRLSSASWPCYRHFAAGGNFSESDLMQSFDLALKVLANPLDRFHIEKLVVTWGLKVNEVQPAPEAKALIARLVSRSLSKEHTCAISAVKLLMTGQLGLQLRKALEVIKRYSEGLVGEERSLVLQDIAAWETHWENFSRARAGGNHDLASFLAQVALGTTQKPPEDGTALLTVHSSKGLEFDVVVIMGMVDGIFPDWRSLEGKEELRNAFVAVTRSKRLLIFSYPQSRVMPWGDVRDSQPSRYLKQMGVIAK